MVWGAGEHGDRASLSGGAKTTLPFTHSLIYTRAHARTHGARDARPAAALEGGEGGEKKSRCVCWPSAAVAVLLLYAADLTDRAAAAVVLWYDITGSLEGWQLSWFVGWCVVFILFFSTLFI